MSSEANGTSFGANSWLVEEMYEQYRADPESVGEAWREFFEDYRSMSAAAQAQSTNAGAAGGVTTLPTVAAPATSAPTPAVAAPAASAPVATPDPTPAVA